MLAASNFFQQTTIQVTMRKHASFLEPICTLKCPLDILPLSKVGRDVHDRPLLGGRRTQAMPWWGIYFSALGSGKTG